jgi:hypothetical protein
MALSVIGKAFVTRNRLKHILKGRFADCGVAGERVPGIGVLVHWEHLSEVTVVLGWIGQFMLGIWEYYIRIKFTNTPTDHPNT